MEKWSKEAFENGKAIVIFGIIVMFIGMLIGMMTSTDINVAMGSNNGNTYILPEDEWEDWEDFECESDCKKKKKNKKNK